MSKVIFDISISLDGFMTASSRQPDEPLGSGGERLHEWAMGAMNGEDQRNREILGNAVSGLGAAIAGRTTYDDSIRWWGADGPSGPARRPLLIVAKPDGGTLRATDTRPAGVGPDLSFWPAHTELWTVTEHTPDRMLYAVPR